METRLRRRLAQGPLILIFTKADADASFVCIFEKAYSVLGLAWGTKNSGCNSRFSYISKIGNL